METLRIVGTAVAAGALLTGTAAAAPSAEAFRKVSVKMPYQVGVSSTGLQQGPSVVSSGPFTETVTFSVAANTDRVDMQVCATDLWKAGVPEAGIPPSQPQYKIPLDAGFTPTLSGLGFAPGSAAMPLTTPLPAEVPAGDSYPWLFVCSGATRFGSSQNGRFSWPLNVTVGWRQGNLQLPVGSYSGFLKLTVFVVPPGF